MKITFVKEIKSSFSVRTKIKDMSLKHVVDIPFCPPVGMYVIDGKWGDVIERVDYDCETGEITAYTPPNKEFYNNIGLRSFHQVYSEYINMGWHV